MARFMGGWPACLLTAVVALSTSAPAAAQESVVATVLRRDLARMVNENEVMLERLAATVGKARQALALPAEVGDKLDHLASEFRRLRAAGKVGEARRAALQGAVLVLGREWTPQEEFRRSLTLRTEPVVCDPDEPITIWLEQFYATTYEPESPLKAEARLLRQRTPSNGPALKALGSFDVSAADPNRKALSFSPDLGDVQEGNYAVVVQVLEGDEQLRLLRAPLRLVRGLNSSQQEIERRLEAIEGHEGTKATIRYPFDFARVVNRGERIPGDFEFHTESQRSLELLADLEQGRDPLWGAKGDLRRHYWFEDAGEIMPYRVYVPETYDGEKPLPLIVALHGSGGTGDVMIAGHNGQMKKLAEQHGYLVAAPLGYRRRASYGRVPKEYRGDAELERRVRLGRQDVMNVVELMREEYRIDEDRIYLMGHSMGGTGTWHLAVEHPEVWAAIAPVSSGGATPEEVDLERIRHLPVLVCHGDRDGKAPVEKARAMVAAMKELGMRYEYFEKPGGTHAMLEASRPRIFQFFDQHRRMAAEQGTSPRGEETVMGVFSDHLKEEVRLERMRPEQIEAAKARRPAVYVPFGSMEWHGRQNAVGLDATKTHEQLVGLAAHAGGVVYPPVFFGAGGGHTDWPHSYMVSAAPMVQIVTELLARFEEDGYRQAILMSGHYPNRSEYLDQAAQLHRERGGKMRVLCLIENQAPGVGGDHAAKYETSSMLYLHPETVDMSQLSGPPTDDVGGPGERINWMGDEYKDHPCYGIVGIDPRAHASAEVGRQNTERLIEFLAKWLDEEAE